MQDTVQLNNLYIREGAEKSSATPRNSEKKLDIWLFEQILDWKVDGAENISG